MEPRKLIHDSESKISYLQIIGFIVILCGLIYLFSEQIFFILTGEAVAIAFFIIMLGFSFAFPDLLRDSNKGLSTMRIVVFMMINVICMLLLKVGWGVNNLKDVGLDQYWMGVIAFVFGAKATQTYFESKLAVPGTGGSPPGGAIQPGGGVTPPVAATDEELDGCGMTPTQLTADNDLPVSKGGMA